MNDIVWTEQKIGRVLALVLPFPMLPAVAWLNWRLGGDAEAIPFLYFPLLGVVQLLWVVPIGVALLISGRTSYAKGMAVGAGLIAVATLVGWAIGLWVGAR